MASITSLRPARASRAAVASLIPGSSSTLLSGDALTLSGVTRAFGALRAVDDVSLTVAAGQKYAILGSNGAGKTTLFNAITGDFPPTAGRIHFFGEDVTTLPPYERIRKGLRRTYQSSLLFRDLTVRDNLFLAVRGVANGRFSFGRPGASHASTVATHDLLERARLSHIADRGQHRIRIAAPDRGGAGDQHRRHDQLRDQRTDRGIPPGGRKMLRPQLLIGDGGLLVEHHPGHHHRTDIRRRQIQIVGISKWNIDRACQ